MSKRIKPIKPKGAAAKMKPDVAKDLSTDEISELETVPVSRSAMRNIDDATRRRFGKNLYRLLNKKRVTATELAMAAFGKDPSGGAMGRDRISKYIHGRSFPERDTLLKLAEVLECDLEELLPQSVLGALISVGDAPIVIKMFSPGRVRITCDFVINEKAGKRLFDLLNELSTESDWNLSGPTNKDKSPHPRS